MATAEAAGARTAREIFAALAAPFGADQVKTRDGGGKRLEYITARAAMNRLDDVVGPENWEDDYYEVCGVLFCRITVTLPDGRRIAKSGSGGFKEMTAKVGGKQVRDDENTDKTGESDAFKRAAVKFGIARDLYKDGVPDFVGRVGPHSPREEDRREPPAPARRDGPGRGDRRGAGPPGIIPWARGMVERANEWYARETASAERLCANEWQLIRHLAKKAEYAGLIEVPRGAKVGEVARLLESMPARHRKETDEVAREYLYSDLPADRAVAASAPGYRGGRPARDPGEEG